MCYYYKVNAQEAIGNPARFEVGHFDPKGTWHVETRLRQR
jgi:hypothetical protein